jgi:hypothetical protein
MYHQRGRDNRQLLSNDAYKKRPSLAWLHIFQKNILLSDLFLALKLTRRWQIGKLFSRLFVRVLVLATIWCSLTVMSVFRSLHTNSCFDLLYQLSMESAESTGMVRSILPRSLQWEIKQLWNRLKLASWIVCIRVISNPVMRKRPLHSRRKGSLALKWNARVLRKKN